jgi:hypothetical protein
LALLIVGAVGAGVAVGVSAQAGPAAPVSILSAADQDQLDLHLHTLPSTAKPAAVAQSGARSNASTFLGALTGSDVIAKPDEILHVMTAPDASSPERSVYVLIWKGGDPSPGGPAPNGLHSVAYRGVVVDDQTGAVVRAFAVGTR